jgi:hypothetical protein
LPEDTPHIFALYIDYVYTGQLNTKQMTEEELVACDRQSFISHIQLEYEYLFQLYVLADKLQDVAAKNAAIIAAIIAAIDITRMRSAKNRYVVPSLSIANNVYEGTAEGSFGRCLVIEMCSTARLGSLLVNMQKAFFHEDLVNDLANVLDKEHPLKRGSVRIKEIQNKPQKYLEKI